MPNVFCTVTEVMADTDTPPKSAMVLISACTPDSLRLSEPVIVKMVCLSFIPNAKEHKKLETRKICSLFYKKYILLA